MTTHINIHPHSRREPMTFRADGPHRPDNANALTLCFRSANHQEDGWPIKTDVTVFHLNATDAEMLSTIGLLDAEHRQTLLPILRHLLDDQTAEAIVALEEATT